MSTDVDPIGCPHCPETFGGGYPLADAAWWAHAKRCHAGERVTPPIGCAPTDPTPDPSLVPVPSVPSVRPDLDRVVITLTPPGAPGSLGWSWKLLVGSPPQAFSGGAWTHAGARRKVQRKLERLRRERERRRTSEQGSLTWTTSLQRLPGPER
jgi:hypothetical protein